MPRVDLLHQEIVRWGYRLVEPEMAEQTLFARITGSAFGNVEAVIRANAEICNVGLFLGLLEGVPDRHRYSLMLEFCELNFTHPLARICLFRATDPTSSQPTYGVILCDTTFFWPEPEQHKFDVRMKALCALSKAASHSMAAKNGISDSNPFSQELKSAKSPIDREELPNRSTSTK